MSLVWLEINFNQRPVKAPVAVAVVVLLKMRQLGDGGSPQKTKQKHQARIAGCHDQ